MKIQDLYLQIYKHFDNLTPLPFDCGSLCGKLCCQNGEGEDTGMYLFPGEDVFFADKAGFEIIDSNFTYSPGKKAKLLLCSKPCNRGERPLSCRIFPIAPYYKSGSPLKVVLDPRAYAYCPLTHKKARNYIDPAFAKEVLYTFRVLMKSGQIQDFVESLSYLLDDYRMFLKG